MMTAAVRAPSTFIPAIYARHLQRGGALKFEEFLYDIKPDEMMWSDTWSRLILPYSNLHPDDAPLYVWRYEKYPQNWREVISTITGYQNPDDFIKSEDALPNEISLYGAALYAQYAQNGETVLGTARHGVDGLFPLDVTQPGSIAGLAHHLDGVPVELLICNAGVYLDKGADLAQGYEPDLWANTFAVNVTGVFLTIQALLPNLQMREGAKIAIVSSQMGSSERSKGGAYIYR